MIIIIIIIIIITIIVAFIKLNSGFQCHEKYLKCAC